MSELSANVSQVGRNTYQQTDRILTDPGLMDCEPDSYEKKTIFLLKPEVDGRGERSKFCELGCEASPDQ